MAVDEWRPFYFTMTKIKIVSVAVALTLFAYVLILSDYAQKDKYAEGWKDCQLYQSQHQKACPILKE